MLSENEGDGELGGSVMELIRLGPLSNLLRTEGALTTATALGTKRERQHSRLTGGRAEGGGLAALGLARCAQSRFCGALRHHSTVTCTGGVETGPSGVEDTLYETLVTRIDVLVLPFCFSPLGGLAGTALTPTAPTTPTFPPLLPSMPTTPGGVLLTELGDT